MSLSEQVVRSAAGALVPWLGASLVWLFLAGGDGLAHATEADGGRGALLRQKLALLERVLERSGDSAVGQAAREALDAARSALDAGDEDIAEVYLMQAFPLAGQAARQRASQLREGQEQQRYQERLAAVNSLRDAYASICESAEQGPDAVVSARVSALLEGGRAAAEHQEYARAERLAEEAQQALVEAIRRLRDHQTVISRLEFASPEEEYRYETRRYRTYELLLKLAAGTPAAEAERTRVEAAQAEGGRRHRQAADDAGRGAWESALDAEQDAVAALMKALRHAGVFIPQ